MGGDLQFSWELTGSGWATCRIADATSERRDVASYCTDALADVLSGIAGLYGARPVQRFSFDLEPVEVRWVLRRTGADVYISIYEFPDMGVSWDLPDHRGEHSWASTQPRRLLAHVVLEAAQSVLKLHGEEGYHKKWVRFPFPTAELQDLRRLHLRQDTCDLPHGG